MGLIAAMMVRAGVRRDWLSEPSVQTVYRPPSRIVEVAREVRGRVLDWVTDLPVAEATIRTVPPTRTVCTNSNGEYVLSGLLFNKPYAIVVGKKGFRPSHTELPPGASPLHCDMVLHPDAESMTPASCRPRAGTRLGPVPAIFGMIRDPATGLAVAGAVVSTIPPSERVLTDDLGIFCLTKRIGPGDYMVLAEYRGRRQEQPGGYRVRVRGDGWTRCDIPLILGRTAASSIPEAPLSP